MGGYDLYGNYYKNTQDAINAEMAQCAEIDRRHDRMDFERQEREVQDNMQVISQYLSNYDSRITELEAKVKVLEEKLNAKDV